MRTLIVSLSLMLGLATAVAAEEALVPVDLAVTGERAPAAALLEQAPAGSASPVAIVVDDGSFENGYTFNTAFFPEFVEWIPLPAGGGSLAALQVCLVTLSTYSPGELEFKYVVYPETGGTAATLTSSNPATVSPLAHTCITTAIVPFPVGNGIYFGARWDGFFEPDVYISADETGPSVGPGFGRRFGLDSEFYQLGMAGFFPNYRNLGLGLLWLPSEEIFADRFESGNASGWSSSSP